MTMNIFSHLTALYKILDTDEKNLLKYTNHINEVYDYYFNNILDRSFDKNDVLLINYLIQFIHILHLIR